MTGEKEKQTRTDMPVGKIGDVSISRLIIGGNLTSGIAHARNLQYVSSLMSHYFTDEKIFETWHIAEANGINTAILRTDDKVIRLLNEYRKRGGKLQWLAQTYPKENDLTGNVQRAIDNGAIGAFCQGEYGDRFIGNKQLDMLVKFIDYIKGKGIIAGIGSHSIEVTKACEKFGLMNNDFYFKSINAKTYPACNDPEETIEFMKVVDKPWIGFKVLGAGVTTPGEGFKYAFEAGADFICVGMFDFQIAEDAEASMQTLAGVKNRSRPWRA